MWLTRNVGLRRNEREVRPYAECDAKASARGVKML
jgi:hypothetical protein